MSKPASRVLNHKLRSTFIVVFLSILAFDLAILSPVDLEQDGNGMRSIPRTQLLDFITPERLTRLMPLPKIPPLYALRDFQLYSSEPGKSPTRIFAKKALSYPTQKRMHLQEPHLWIEEKNSTTYVKSAEATHDAENGVVDAVGNVVATLEDGSEIRAEKSKLYLKPEKRMEVPLDTEVNGHDGKPLAFRTTFQGYGMTYDATTERIELLSRTFVLFPSKEGDTLIHSDRGIFFRSESRIEFWMDENRPFSKQFVKTDRNKLHVESRRMIGLIEPGKSLEKAIAIDDVSFIDRQDPKTITRGSAGHAVFETKTDLLTLTLFPVVYQENDTVNGEKIVYDRRTDTVFADQSNASNRN
jgi:LPS export ABC transporter protein LptC/lipopolysaccharide transport protein LptA